MVKFKGFGEPAQQPTVLPEGFFLDLLPGVDHLGELKVTLWAFRLLEHVEGGLPYLKRADFAADARLMAGLGRSKKAAQVALDDSLERAVKRGALLEAVIPQPGGEVVLYFINSARGRAAVAAIERGEWRQADIELEIAQARPLAPNLYQLYEQHIGPLTPMIAEALRDAEQTYPVQWLQDAIRIAVENNARNWRYVLAILKRWQTEGRDERKDRPDTEKSRRRYVEGEFADYIEH